MYNFLKLTLPLSLSFRSTKYLIPTFTLNLINNLIPLLNPHLIPFKSSLFLSSHHTKIKLPSLKILIHLLVSIISLIKFLQPKKSLKSHNLFYLLITILKSSLLQSLTLMSQRLKLKAHLRIKKPLKSLFHL